MQDNTAIHDFAARVAANIEQVIVGKGEAIELMLIAMLCEGHVLIEDVPGVGKTMLARALATSVGGQFKRLQCTPDLLPNDVTGVSIFNQRTSEFEFRPGPIFVNVLLADEINRATPRTQAALLEAMQEQQVSVDGVTHPLPRPFMVLGTQNPIEFEGTFPLPEAQLDRFLMRITLGYPSAVEEKRVLQNLRREHPILGLGAVAQASDLIALQRAVWDVHVDDSLSDYIIALVAATRQHADIAVGASPRASLALFKTAQAAAALRGRDHVLPDDVKRLASYVLPHRMLVKPDAELRARTPAVIVREILASTSLAI